MYINDDKKAILSDNELKTGDVFCPLCLNFLIENTTHFKCFKCNNSILFENIINFPIKWKLTIDASKISKTIPFKNDKYLNIKNIIHNVLESLEKETTNDYINIKNKLKNIIE